MSRTRKTNWTLNPPDRASGWVQKTDRIATKRKHILVLFYVVTPSLPDKTGSMSLRRRRQFIHGNVAWMLGTATVLVLLDALSAELFFVVSLIGFLVVTELTAPFAITPAWRRRLRWIIAIGLVVFGYIVIRRILAILPEGVI